MIDFHCHLDLYPNPSAVVQDCSQKGIYVLSVTTTPKAWHGTSALTRNCSRIQTALGLHPQLAHQRANELPLFKKLLKETRYVGEIGLDGSQEYRQYAEVQRRVFRTILYDCSEAGGRILSIHSRGAISAVLDELASYPGAGVPVLHWFSGNQQDLDTAIAMGCWFSVGPAMLKSVKGQEIAARLPRDRVLTETDGPFGLNGRIPLQPKDVLLAESTLADLWKMDQRSVNSMLRESLLRLVSKNTL